MTEDSQRPLCSSMIHKLMRFNVIDITPCYRERLRDQWLASIFLSSVRPCNSLESYMVSLGVNDVGKIGVSKEVGGSS